MSIRPKISRRWRRSRQVRRRAAGSKRTRTTLARSDGFRHDPPSRCFHPSSTTQRPAHVRPGWLMMDALEAIRTRRSLRQLDGRPVPQALLDEALALACLAPAPHHTRPWRYVVVGSERRSELAERMGDAWRADLEGDGHSPELVEKLLAKSRRQIVEAPALGLACLTHDGLRDWPDERRVRNEWGIAQQAVRAGMPNLMLSAH